MFTVSCPAISRITIDHSTLSSHRRIRHSGKGLRGPVRRTGLSGDSADDGRDCGWPSDLNHFGAKLMLILPARPAPPVFALGKSHWENIRSKKRKGADAKRREMEGEIGMGQVRLQTLHALHFGRQWGRRWKENNPTPPAPPTFCKHSL